MQNERVDLEVGDLVRLEMPASEVMQHMKVVGQVFEVEIRANSAQLYKDGQPFSIPVSWGEAGLYTDQLTKKPYSYTAERIREAATCTKLGCTSFATTKVVWWTVSDPMRQCVESKLCPQHLDYVERRLDLVIDKRTAMMQKEN
ncbi:hypothetical protein ABZ543_13305 [Streptomyces roseifaciens]